MQYSSSGAVQFVSGVVSKSAFGVPSVRFCLAATKQAISSEKPAASLSEIQCCRKRGICIRNVATHDAMRCLCDIVASIAITDVASKHANDSIDEEVYIPKSFSVV